MATPAVFIRAIETTHVKLGDAFFVHSKKETSMFVPLDKVSLFEEQGIWIPADKGHQQLLLNKEIVEVQFV